MKNATSPTLIDLAERLISLLFLPLFCVMVLATLTRIEKQTQINSAKQDQTLEAIRKQVRPEEWEKSKELLNRILIETSSPPTK
jgi:hypothetical protein